MLFDRKMAELRDEHGSPIHQTDEYGHPIYPTGATSAGMAPVGHDTGVHQKKEHHGLSGMLHRSGSSSSSSSSEDDGQGGRRKRKGLKEKIKEKLPGGHKKAETGQAGHDGKSDKQHGGQPKHAHGKKGVLEKIKAKLPGS